MDFNWQEGKKRKRAAMEEATWRRGGFPSEEEVKTAVTDVVGAGYFACD